jgi:hypothetical protein
MFMTLAQHIPTQPGNLTQTQKAERVLTQDPATLSLFMESLWSRGGSGRLTGVPSLPSTPVGFQLQSTIQRASQWAVVWEHLIYAYMIENTRAYEIMGRVLTEFTQGERLGVLREPASYQWLRTTEELFYKDASPIQPYNLVSRIRPDIAATRRNAYYRMFGMDLNHGRDGTPQAYAYAKPTAANREFVATFEEFLREVWRATENANNRSGANPSDFAAIADLARRLQNMLTARRGGAFTKPNLSREEFLAVCLAGWLHLTLSVDSPIVRDLAAAGPSPEERLRQIGERVGLPSHGRSHSYFLLANPVSTILIGLERGDFSSQAGALTLAAPGPVNDLVRTVVHHWQQISGRDLKAPRVAVSPGQPSVQSSSAQVALMPSSVSLGVSATAPTNGKVPAGSS